jgi:predicted amidophosphoribosyltransferase
MVLDTSLYSSCKPKTIATSLFCTKCEKNYQPNEYYRHLKKCEEESKVVSRLLQKRDNIEKQISAMKRKEAGEEVVDRVVVVLKNKDRMSVTSRPKVR